MTDHDRIEFAVDHQGQRVGTNTGLVFVAHADPQTLEGERVPEHHEQAQHRHAIHDEHAQRDTHCRTCEPALERLREYQPLDGPPGGAYGPQNTQGALRLVDLLRIDGRDCERGQESRYGAYCEQRNRHVALGHLCRLVDGY